MFIIIICIVADLDYGFTLHWKKSQISWSKKLQEMYRKFLNEIYWTKTVVIWYLGNVICQVHSLELMEISHFMYIFKIKYTRHFLAVPEISYISFTLLWWKTDDIYCSFPLSTRSFIWSWTHDIYCTFPLGTRKCIHIHFQDQGHMICTTHFNTT